MKTYASTLKSVKKFLKTGSFKFPVYEEIDKDVIIGAVRACSNREVLERTFELFNIADYDKRYDILVEAMYSPKMFFSCENLNSIQKYELTVESFLTMEWKLTEAYKRIGI